MVKVAKVLSEELQEMVDEHGIETVLDELVKVCYATGIRHEAKGRKDQARYHHEIGIKLVDIQIEEE